MVYEVHLWYEKGEALMLQRKEGKIKEDAHMQPFMRDIQALADKYCARLAGFKMKKGGTLVTRRLIEGYVFLANNRDNAHKFAYESAGQRFGSKTLSEKVTIIESNNGR